MSKAREIILKLVADGKISVEEAEELLDAIEKTPGNFADFFGAKQAKAGARARERAERAKARAKGPGRQYRYKFGYEFDFPWDQPDWQWPWEKPGWQWPWEKPGSPQERGHPGRTSKPASVIEVPEKAQLKIRVDGGDLKIRSTEETSLRFTNPHAVRRVTTEGEVVHISSAGSNLGMEVPAKVVSIEVALKGGDMRAQDLKTDLVASVTGGDMSISKATGHIQASVDGGDVRLADVGSEEVEVRTHAGDIHLIMIPVVEKGSVSLGSESGDISLFLPPDSRCQISANAPGGKVSHSLPAESAEITDEADTRLNARLNGGGAEFVLSTGKGDINIKA